LGDAQAAIQNAREVYASAYEDLAQTKVIVAIDGKLELGIATEDNFDLYRGDSFNPNGFNNRVEQARSKLTEYIDQVDEEATNEALKALSRVGLYLQVRNNMYGQIAQSFTSAGNAWNAYRESRVKEGVEPARMAGTALAGAVKKNQALKEGLTIIQDDYDYEVSFDGWAPSFEESIHKYVTEIGRVYTPANEGLRLLLEGSTIETDSSDAFENGEYEASLNGATEADNRFQQGNESVQTALAREPPYFQRTYEQMKCATEDRIHDVAILRDAAQQAIDGNEAQAEDTYQQYRDSLPEVNCNEETTTTG
jgi:hypothetical protein